MRKSAGFSLLEVLVSMGILSVLLLVTFAAIGDFTQAQREQAVASELQGKLRRAAEILGQEVRGAAFGALADDPYTSDADSLSFALLAGPAGLAVLYSPTFDADEYFDVFAGDTLNIEENDEVTLVNNTGAARNFLVTAVEDLGAGTWRLHHSGCANGIAYTASTLAFETRRVGLEYDRDTDTVRYYESGTTHDLLYGITKFQIRYQYLKNGSEEVLDPAGFNPSDGPPYRRFTDGAGDEYELRGVMLYATSTRKVANRNVTVTVQTPVALTTADTIFVSQIDVCR